MSRPSNALYAKYAQALKMRTFKEGGVCARCGGEFLWEREYPNLPGGVRSIDWYRNNLAFSADHEVPYAVDPSRFTDPTNLIPMHLGCNKSKGARMKTGAGSEAKVEGPKKNSRAWL